jgi:hypothetical protein
MALGVQGSYVVIYLTGHMQWDLKGSYDRLDGYLDKVNVGELLYVSLSPYHEDRFFAAYKDASVLYSFDESWTTLDQAFLHCNELGVVIDSDTMKHTSTVVMQKTPRFGMELVKVALEGTMEGLAEQAVDAAIG